MSHQARRSLPRDPTLKHAFLKHAAAKAARPWMFPTEPPGSRGPLFLFAYDWIKGCKRRDSSLACSFDSENGWTWTSQLGLGWMVAIPNMQLERDPVQNHPKPSFNYYKVVDSYRTKSRVDWGSSPTGPSQALGCLLASAPCSWPLGDLGRPHPACLQYLFQVSKCTKVWGRIKRII